MREKKQLRMESLRSIVIELFCNHHSVKWVTHAVGEKRERGNNDGRREKVKNSNEVMADSVVASALRNVLEP